jgi:XTP/dITP diphosphohydrolase
VGFELKGKVVFLATGNIHKFNETRAVLAEQGLTAAMLRMKGVEIQSENLAEIAGTSALATFKECHLPIIVEDAGLFVDALKGFPGPYTAYVYNTIGNAGLLKQMENLLNRQATFRSAVAYCDNLSGAVTCFEGEAAGELTHIQRRGGRATFGFDPIFKPDCTDKTFAEMTLEEKNKFSHRAKAIRKFAEWYKST